MEPVQFGASRSLFGLRSEPVGRPRSTAVLVCHSWGMEYMRAYRAMHLLAQQLATDGFDTLRFDYSCTGDSGGYSGEARLEQWAQDVAEAAEELRSLSGCESVCVVALRLGALIASAALKAGARFERAVLWDAPPSGRDWVDEMRRLDDAFFQRKNRYRGRATQLASAPGEILGMPFHAQLDSALSAFEPALALGADRVRAFRSRDYLGDTPWIARPPEPLPDDAYWLDAGWLSSPWTPSNSLRELSTQLAGWLP